jgi:hypothetical protein
VGHIPDDKTVDFNISCHTQHAAHGWDHGEDTPKGLGSIVVGIAMDTNQGPI